MPTAAPQAALTHLDVLESESIHIIREVAAEFERPVLMFSGGKDSIVMLRLAEKAFYPAKIPFPVLQVDTGFDFPEVLATRDRWVDRLGIELHVASVEQAIADGIVIDDGKTSRNRLQTPTLLNAIEENGFTAAFGGGRRDEEKARAKERVYSHRDEFGQWDPKNQRPELWSLYNGRLHEGEHEGAETDHHQPVEDTDVTPLEHPGVTQGLLEHRREPRPERPDPRRVARRANRDVLPPAT